jgi:hypothetical protein
MRTIKALLVTVTAVGALALAAPAFAADAPFPMNPFPGASTDYTFNLQTLFGHGSKVRPTVYCADSSVFRRGNQIVFRMYMVDAKSGKVMNGKDISSMVLKVAGMADAKMGFKPQGGSPDATSPWLWATTWTVPDDYPLGTFKFNIVAQLKTNGKPGKYITYDPVIPGTDWEITP